MVEVGLRALPQTVFCEPAQWATGDTMEGISQNVVSTEESSVAHLSAGVLQSCLLHTAVQKQIWGIYSNNWAEDPAPNRGVTTTE